MEASTNYVHVEDGNHTEPEITVSTTSNDGSSAEYTVYPANNKPKRKRAPWVYKSDYDNLQRKYSILSWLTWAGWIAFIVTLKFAI